MSSVARIARFVPAQKIAKCRGAIAPFRPLNPPKTAGLNLIRLQHTEPDTNRSTIEHKEKPIGESTRHEFQAETRTLLDIVARSLYSDKEVFVRELISNASDALEKLRYLTMGDATAETSREIRIFTDKNARTFTIQDNGIGMTKTDLLNNLGVIAKSGSKSFIEQVKKQQENGGAGADIIGQFGVGFYSVFMVADNVEVYTRHHDDAHGWKWTSDGTGAYEIQPADNVTRGTKITLHLKGECREFSDEKTIENVITKYSQFVGSAIWLNGTKTNPIRPLWLAEPKTVGNQQYVDFYKLISANYDAPRYVLHYKTDVPLSIAALLYFPEGKPGLFEMSREMESGVALYTKKVLIKNKTDNILPKWLRFVKGVVDSEDIPLNLSRELLQNSNLIRKLRDVLTGRITKFLLDQVKKDQKEYEKFYRDYGIFIKEGIITNHNQTEKEDAAKLLLFESSHLEPGTKVTLHDYVARAREERTIFYLAAPSRALAEASPYYEPLKKRHQEVLFCYEPYDELVLMQLQQFEGRRLISVEKDMRDDKAANDLTDLGGDSLKRSEINELCDWLKSKLSGKVTSVNATTRLENHPCVVTVEEMAAARHFVRTQSHGLPDDRRYAILQPQFEINPRHPIIKKMHKLKSSDPDLAELLANQLFANSMVGAGLVDDPRLLLTSMNDLLARALEKH